MSAYNAGMSAVLKSAIIGVAALTGATSFADRFNHYKVGQLKGFTVLSAGGHALLESKIPGNVKRSFSATFANFSQEEVAEIDLHLHISSFATGKTTYDGPSITVKEFSINLFAHRGSLLPACKGSLSTPVVQDYPGRFWTTLSTPSPSPKFEPTKEPRIITTWAISLQNSISLKSQKHLRFSKRIQASADLRNHRDSRLAT